MTAPLCRYCGKPIGKRTDTVFVRMRTKAGPSMLSGSIRTIEVDKMPVDKAECQRLTNDRITSVRRSADGSAISKFTTWDGETYVDRFFCNGDHARSFAYVMATAGHRTKAYAQAAATTLTEKVEAS